MSENQQQNESDLAFAVMPVGFLQCNCTVMVEKSSKKALVFDPGGNVDQIIGAVNELGGEEVIGIYCTHAHSDHIMGVGELKEKTNATVYICEMDLELWNKVDDQCRKFGLPTNFKKVDPDVFIKEGDTTCIGNGKILHTPGHSPGSVSIYFEDAGVIVVGDVLFRHSIGRTDLWGGNTSTLFKSIKEKVFTLPPNTEVVTGHGPFTTVGDEINGNPFL